MRSPDVLGAPHQVSERGAEITVTLAWLVRR